jgi:autotransporter translocation and assembly factor TamB
MSLNGITKAFTWGEFEADTVSMNGSFTDAEVQLDRLVLRQEGKASLASGTFPLELSLYPFTWEVPEREMNLQVTAEDGSLKNVELTPWIYKASGSLEADVRVGGTPRAPRFFGKATVNGGEVEIENRDEVVVDIVAEFLFEDDLIQVRHAQGIVGVNFSDPREVGGLATASGTYRLGAHEEETYELVVHGDRVVVGEEGVYAARASGDLVIKPERAWDGIIYPFARGNVFVHRADYAGTLQPQDIGQLEPKSILYSVEIDAPAHVYIFTEGVDAELGGEQITVHQDVDKQSIFGRLEIYRCSYEFFQRTFKTSRGELILERADNRLPEMDIYAETFVCGYEIAVDLTGRADEPVVEFFAFQDGIDAGLSQEQIIRLLAVGCIGLNSGPGDLALTDSGIGAPETTEQVAVSTSQFFLGPIERELGRQLGFVDEVDIETEGNLGEFLPMVGLRKWVTPELSVQYRQGLSGTYEQELGVEYRLKRALYLRGAMTNNYLRSRGAAQEYNLDLKFRLSY